MNNFIRSITGGVLIGLGGTCFLSVDNKVLGAFLFSLGLYAICATEQLLFTGRASYSMDYKELLLILLGNFLGATAIGFIIGINNLALHDKAVAMCQNKIHGDGLVYILGFFCNILIYFAVEGYKKNQPLLLIMCVMAFILCGFEHSIADIYYFAVARAFRPIDILFLVTVVISNWNGGIVVQAFKALKEEGDE